MRGTDPVGIAEAAERLGITPGELHRAHSMGRFIPPRWASVNGAPAWRWADVERWAEHTRFPLPIVARYRRRERTSA